jgi:hypothetical protein
MTIARRACEAGKARSSRDGETCYTALEVLLDEGHWQLFWYHELEEVDEGT